MFTQNCCLGVKVDFGIAADSVKLKFSGFKARSLILIIAYSAISFAAAFSRYRWGIR